MSANLVKRTVQLRKGDGPAVDINAIREAGHVDLAKRADKVGIALSKRELTGIRAQVRLYVDHSGSMEFRNARDYTNGNVQKLVERALAFGLQVDVDGVIPVMAFDNRLHPAINVGVQDDPQRGVERYIDVVNRRIWRPDAMGGTSFCVIMQDILRAAQSTDVPLYCAIVTDGSPSDREQATPLVIELAGYPVFLKFLAIRPVEYLDVLDNLEQTHPGSRLLDNVDTKFFDGVVPNPAPISTITDAAFADAMVDEWQNWFAAGQRAGVLQ